MSFTESNTVEQMILDAATSLGSGAGGSVLREDPPAGWGGMLGEEFKRGGQILGGPSQTFVSVSQSSVNVSRTFGDVSETFGKAPETFVELCQSTGNTSQHGGGFSRSLV